MSFFITVLLIHYGVVTNAQVDDLKKEISQMQVGDLEMRQEIKDKRHLHSQAPTTLITAYNRFLNQVRLLESYSGTSMDVQLEENAGTQDIMDHFKNTEYKGIKGLKIRIVVKKFTKEADMGAVLDDIHILETYTDFMACEISQENDRLIVKGEIYGI